MAIGTTASTAAAGNHTHTASLATDTGTSAITLAYSGKYKLTAGGQSVIFTMPASDNTNTTYKLTLNGTDTGGGSTSLGTVYGATTAGTSGQYLKSSGSGAPTWANMPTSLPANGGNAATVGGHTVGVDVPSNAVFTDNNTTYKLNINGQDQGGGSTSLGTVYAPSTAGTSGQYLASSGSGAPTWTNFPTIPSKMSDVASISVSAITSDTSSACSITGAGNAGKSQTIIYTNSSGADLTVTVPTTYTTPDGAAIELTCPNGGYCEVNYLNIGGTIYARGL